MPAFRSFGTDPIPASQSNDEYRKWLHASVTASVGSLVLSAYIRSSGEIEASVVILGAGVLLALVALRVAQHHRRIWVRYQASVLHREPSSISVAEHH